MLPINQYSIKYDTPSYSLPNVVISADTTDIPFWRINDEVLKPLLGAYTVDLSGNGKVSPRIYGNKVYVPATINMYPTPGSFTPECITYDLLVFTISGNNMTLTNILPGPQNVSDGFAVDVSNGDCITIRASYDETGNILSRATKRFNPDTGSISWSNTATNETDLGYNWTYGGMSTYGTRYASVANFSSKSVKIYEFNNSSGPQLLTTITDTTSTSFVNKFGAFGKAWLIGSQTSAVVENAGTWSTVSLGDTFQMIVGQNDAYAMNINGSSISIQNIASGASSKRVVPLNNSSQYLYTMSAGLVATDHSSLRFALFVDPDGYGITNGRIWTVLSSSDSGNTWTTNDRTLPTNAPGVGYYTQTPKMAISSSGYVLYKACNSQQVSDGDFVVMSVS